MLLTSEFPDQFFLSASGLANSREVFFKSFKIYPLLNLFRASAMAS